MRKVRVNLKDAGYEIIIAAKILSQTGKLVKKLPLGANAYIITNSLIKSKYGKALSDSLNRQKINSRFKLVADSERSKSLKVALSLIKDITDYEPGKGVFIIALGGGVIGDLAGFVASIYKRGIPYIQVPTTLLSQVDSSIGGKTAVDLRQGKNLVGAFYQPRLIISDISCLKTLSARQIRSGLAEAIKYGIIKDSLLFNYIESNYKNLLKKDLKKMEFLVWRCSRIKAGIVGTDEKEKKGLRTILNFGHTLGHAIESASGYKSYNHGEAVAVGMLCAADISRRLGLIEEGLLNRIEKLIQSVGLPTKIKRLSIEKIMQAQIRDKKFLAGKNRFVLINHIGKTIIKTDIPRWMIKAALLARA